MIDVVIMISCVEICTKCFGFYINGVFDMGCDYCLVQFDVIVLCIFINVFSFFIIFLYKLCVEFFKFYFFLVVGVLIMFFLII